MDRMTKGDLLPLLNYIKSDNELRLEIRRKNEAFIYYRKGKTLEVRGLKVSSEYGDVPSTALAVSKPKEYFRLIKESIDNWLDCKKDRAEFDTQQNIAKFNQDQADKYIILDMEYGFEQNQIEINDREKPALFDLIGIERKTNRIVFFEVKTGMGATKGKSGIEDHINDFETYLFGKNSVLFKENLVRDIKNIIEDKIKLGILKNFEIPSDLGQLDPELVFVFHPDKDSEITDFKRELQDRHKLIIVNNDNYKLT